MSSSFILEQLTDVAARASASPSRADSADAQAEPAHRHRELIQPALERAGVLVLVLNRARVDASEKGERGAPIRGRARRRTKDTAAWNNDSSSLLDI